MPPPSVSSVSTLVSLLTLVGVDFKIKVLDMENGERVKLTIWDTAGQERFRTLTSSYYRGAHGVILVYDVCSRDSFASIQNIWMRELRTYAEPEEMILMVVANKIDKVHFGRVPHEWADDGWGG